MSHVYRFIGSRDAAKSWRLSNDDVQHISRVLRLDVGDAIEIADGCGWVATAQIAAVSKNHCSVTVDSEALQPPSSTPIAVAVGALKPAAIDELIPQLVELGVDVLAVFGQKHVAKFRTGPEQAERWERIVRASVKQCKRAWFPKIENYQDIDQCIAAFADWRRLVLDPEANQHILDLADSQHGRPTVAFVGGERGFDGDEMAQLSVAQCIPVTIGANILRAVTACSAAAFALDYRRA